MKNNRKRTFGFILAIFLAQGIGGCRIGNHSSDAPNTQATLTHSEYFFTDVKQFETEIDYNDSTPSIGNPNTLTEAVPSEIVSTFTSPVLWGVESNNQQFFIDKALSTNPWITYADTNGQINTVQGDQDPPTPFYLNPNCLTQVKIYQQGNFDRTTPGTTVLPGTSTQTKVSGHLKLEIIWNQTFTGDCAADLQTLANCYNLGNTCNSDQIYRAKIFDVFVHGAGLSLQNASKIKSLAYDVHFE